MADKRKDSKGRNLKDNEDQMPDGRYRFRYTD
ncbi:MAG: integrase DNA-binding domain-containing protein, partial [Fusicatenibacter sp.]|nr:integrase DNA-binding domain-containing protein [Fusicatenibacter sp.]